MKKVLIIGGGIGGLASAVQLAKEGFEVELFEKNENLGGRANVFSEDGFRFDMGPSWYLMPDVFEKFFTSVGKDIKDYLSLEQLTPSYRVFFEDKTYYDISTDLNELGDLFESWEKGSKEKLKEFIQRSEESYHIAMKDFVYKNYSSIFSFFNKRLLIEGTKLHVFENMEKYVSRFFKDKRIQQIMQYTLVFLGGSPKNTPALYNIMSHIDFNMGVWYPKGGMYEIPTALTRMAIEFGARLHVDAPVEKICIDPDTKKASGILLTDGTYVKGDVILSNGDYHFTETRLLPKKYQQYSDAYWNKRTQSPSAFIIYLGLNKKLAKLQHHNLFFASNWQKHFAEIFDSPEWPSNPSIYIGCPSKTDPTVAPEYGENVFILVPVASGLMDDGTIRALYESKIISMLEEWLGESIESHIHVKKIFTVSDFKKKYNSHKGSALGLAHTLFQTAFFRPTNQSKKVANLFYTGANTTPGIGVPMCLISSQLTSQQIKKYVRRH